MNVNDALKDLEDEVAKDVHVLMGMPRPEEAPKPFCTFTIEPGDIEKICRENIEKIKTDINTI